MSDDDRSSVPPGLLPRQGPSTPAAGTRRPSVFGVVPGSEELTNTALKRIPLTLTVRKEYEFFSDFIAEFGAHIYPEGMFVPAGNPKPKGSAVRIDFKLKDGFQIILATGEVVRADDGIPGATNGMWVSFRVLDPDQAALIRRIADQRDAEKMNTPSGGLSVASLKQSQSEPAQMSAAPSAPGAPRGEPGSESE